MRLATIAAILALVIVGCDDNLARSQTPTTPPGGTHTHPWHHHHFPGGAFFPRSHYPYSYPVYSYPIYSAPVYSAPIYSDPLYSYPVYSAPVYSYPRFGLVAPGFSLRIR